MSARNDSRPGDTRVRILLVASTLHIGGAENVIADLARSLDRSRFDVLVCYLRENGLVGEMMQKDGVELVPVPGRKSDTTDYLTSLKLRRLVRVYRRQVIHSHDTHGLVDCGIVSLLTPSVRHIHTFHFGNYPNLEANHARLERLMWRIPDRLVAVGRAQAQSIANYYRMKPTRLSVLHNGVGRHSVIADETIVNAISAAGRPVIASISTLTRQKGLHYLLEALALMGSNGTDAVLVLAGDGSQRGALRRHAEELGVADRVRFLGWIPDAARRLLPVSDVFVQSSLWEAMSIVVLEAMAASKPMVVTSVGENPHILEHERSALIVPPADPVALASALARVIREPELAIRIGQGALERYDRDLTVQQMVRRYEDLYLELVAATR